MEGTNAYRPNCIDNMTLSLIRIFSPLSRIVGEFFFFLSFTLCGRELVTYHVNHPTLYYGMMIQEHFYFHPLLAFFFTTNTYCDLPSGGLQLELNSHRSMKWKKNTSYPALLEWIKSNHSQLLLHFRPISNKKFKAHTSFKCSINNCVQLFCRLMWAWPWVNNREGYVIINMRKRLVCSQGFSCRKANGRNSSWPRKYSY